MDCAVKDKIVEALGVRLDIGEMSGYMVGRKDGTGTSFEWDDLTSPLQDHQGLIQYSLGVAVHGKSQYKKSLISCINCDDANT